MKFNFDFNTEKFLKFIARSAQIQKIRVFFVGGMVRDAILKKDIQDIDLIVEGNAIEFINKIEPKLKIKSIHEDFCTVKVEFDNKIYDIASTRTEFYPHSGSLPVLSNIGVPIEIDVKRRDFSVNSLYCEFKLDEDRLKYTLIDLVDGVNDIQNKTLKVLHKSSYIDDPTRILRGLDFSLRFGFNFSCDDKNLIEQYLSEPDREFLSTDRCLCVFKKIFKKDNYLEVFKEIIENKYYKILFNQIKPIDLYEVEKAIILFELNNNEISLFLLDVLANKKINKIEYNSYFELKSKFRTCSKNDLAYYFYTFKDFSPLEYLRISAISLLVNGNDLLKIGYSKGEKIGHILRELFNCKADNTMKFITLMDEIDWCKTHFPI